MNNISEEKKKNTKGMFKRISRSKKFKYNNCNSIVYNDNDNK